MSLLDRLSQLLGIPVAGVVAIVAFAAAQLAAQLWALLDLVRRPVVRGANRWLWAAIILFGNVIGVMLYVAVGRSAEVPADEGYARGGDVMSARRAVEILYGPREPS